MTNKEFNNEKLYQTTMSLMRSLLTQGTITQKEYCRIDTIFLEKYQPVFGKLYSDKKRSPPYPQRLTSLHLRRSTQRKSAEWRVTLV